MENLERMAGSRGMDAAVFADQYVRLVGDRLSLREHIINGEHFCCFFDRIDHRCAIYQNRPKQCETFPFWDKFKDEQHDLMLECPGIVLTTNSTRAL
jgi:Fe-S-cluster containining protein